MLLRGAWAMRYAPTLMTTNHFDGPFIAVPVWALDVIREHGQPRDLQVLVGLVGCMDLRTRTVTASSTQVADFMGISAKTVKRAVKWLESVGVIVVTRRANSVNVYTVVYNPGRGVTGDPRGGHRSPQVGSRETPPTEPRGVTGDPTNSSVSPAQTTDSNSTEIYISDREIIEVIERVPSGDEGSDMILGSDPDDEREELPVKPARKASPRNFLDLANMFMYHPKSLMSQNYTPRDRTILMATMKRLAESGVTKPTISRMINRFWTHPVFPSYENHVQAFASRAVQQTLMSDVDVQVEDSNPVLNMMANDFDRGEADLPWDRRADQQLAKVIMMRCMDACYRYPEIVANIAQQWNGDFSDISFLRTIDAFNSLIRWHTAQESIDHDDIMKTLECVTLPSELHSTEPTMLRAPAGTIGEAVYNYRRFARG